MKHRELRATAARQHTNKGHYRARRIPMRSPYPLAWPDGWKRATTHESSRFGIGFSEARRRVLQELDRLGAANAVITSDLPTRNDGLPYANATCSDPGIAVWWVEKQKEQVIACDRWRTVANNMRAIVLSLEALRGLDRWGSSQMVERAFAGFKALPPGEHETVQVLNWREVLGFAQYDFDPRTAPPVVESLKYIKDTYRRLMLEAHPDRGGSAERAAQLNATMAAAEKELG